MLTSNLPQAVFKQEYVRLGSVVVKTQKPTQSYSDAQKGLDNLKKATENKVFMQNDFNK